MKSGLNMPFRECVSVFIKYYLSVSLSNCQGMHDVTRQRSKGAVWRFPLVEATTGKQSGKLQPRL